MRVEKIQENKLLVHESIDGKPIKRWAALITRAAQQERKKLQRQYYDLPRKRSHLENFTTVLRLLTHAHLLISISSLEKYCRVSKGTINRWSKQVEDGDAKNSVKLFMTAFQIAREEINLYAASNITKAIIERGDLQLSEKVLIANNDDLNPKRRIERNETKNINIRFEQMSDEQLDQKLKVLAKKTGMIELKKEIDKDGNPVYQSNNKASITDDRS